MRILVVAPHPDDEVLGCGGTLLRHSSKGDLVHLCVITQAYTPDWSEEFIRKRPKEVETASKILGIKGVTFLGFPTVKLDTVPQKQLVESIHKVIQKTKPDVVYVPHKGDVNKDHRLVFEACLVALRPYKNRTFRVLSYETLSETEWGQPITLFAPNVYVDISDYLKNKVKAMGAYSSELRDYPHPRSKELIEVLARKRGSEAMLEFAEAFMLIREVVV